MWIPFLVEFQDSQVENFENSVFIRKRTFLRNFAEAGVYTFDSVSRVHYLTYGTAVIKKLLDVFEVVFPYGDGAGIFLPILFKLVESPLRFFCIDSPINTFQLLRKNTPLLPGNITNWVSYEMNNAALYGDVWKNSLGTFLQARYAINRENA